MVGAARKHSASLRRDKPGSGHPVRDGGAGPVPSLTLRATMAAEEQGSGPVPSLTLRATMAAEGQGPGPVLADASGYDGSGRTRGRTGSITDASGYEIICALFTFLRARRLQRSSFLRPGRLDRGAERGSCLKTGPREKRPGPQKPKARARRSCAEKCRSRAQVREKLCDKGTTRSFLCRPVLGSAQIASRPRRHDAGCRRGCLPLWLHSQDGPSDFTRYSQRVCAGERRPRRGSGVARIGPAGKKRDGLLQNMPPIRRTSATGSTDAQPSSQDSQVGQLLRA